MATFGTLNLTSSTTSADKYLIRQGGVDYKQTREHLAAGVANARWDSTATYDAGSEIFGSDNKRYVALFQTTGTDPTTDGGSTWDVVAGIGADQTWQDVTGSRAELVVYTNTAGRPIYVSVISTQADGSGLQLYVDGVLTDTQDTPPGSLYTVTIGCIVPDDSTYEVRATVAGGVIGTWLELK
jgi:hypothetical protein